MVSANAMKSHDRNVWLIMCPASVPYVPLASVFMTWSQDYNGCRPASHAISLAPPGDQTCRGRLCITLNNPDVTVVAAIFCINIPNTQLWSSLSLSCQLQIQEFPFGSCSTCALRTLEMTSQHGLGGGQQASDLACDGWTDHFQGVTINCKACFIVFS